MMSSLSQLLKTKDDYDAENDQNTFVLPAFDIF